MSASASRRSFWPTVLVGAFGAGTAAIAGNQPWVYAGSETLTDASGGVIGERPDVTAVALVALASWGVLLVTRGWVRRVLAAVSAVAALATTALSIQGLSTTPSTDSVRLSFTAPTSESLTLSHGAWGWIAVLGSLLAVGAAAYAIKATPHWPEMGRRYYAPVTAAAAAPETSLDWWKAIDEGRDPTDEGTPGDLH